MDEEKGGFFQGFLILAIVITVLLIPCWALIWRNTVTEPPAVIIGPAQAAPEAVATPNFLAQVALVYAESEAESRRTDGEIKVMVVQNELGRRWLREGVLWGGAAGVVFVVLGVWAVQQLRREEF